MSGTHATSASCDLDHDLDAMNDVSVAGGTFTGRSLYRFGRRSDLVSFPAALGVCVRVVHSCMRKIATHINENMLLVACWDPLWNSDGSHVVASDLLG